MRKLIAGPTVFICDDCVELCTDILKEETNVQYLDPEDRFEKHFGIELPGEVLIGKGAVRVTSIIAALDTSKIDNPKQLETAIGMVIVRLAYDKIIAGVDAVIATTESELTGVKQELAKVEHGYNEDELSLFVRADELTLEKEELSPSEKALIRGRLESLRGVLELFDKHRRLQAHFNYLNGYRERIVAINTSKEKETAAE